jgi:hypothetical protein
MINPLNYPKYTLPFPPLYSKQHFTVCLYRNKLIVTKHQSQQKQLQQHQTSNPQSLLVVDDLHAISYQHHSSDGSDDANNDCLSDSTIEKMRLQVRMQREKVEDER